MCFIHPNSLEFLGKIYPVALIDLGLIHHIRLDYNSVNDYNFPNVGANLKCFLLTHHIAIQNSKVSITFYNYRINCKTSKERGLSTKITSTPFS